MGRAVFLLSLAAFASAASLRATDPLLPLIAEEYGVTAGAASAAVTAFALSYGLLQVVCGPLGDRFGRYRTIAAAAFVSAFGSAACAIAPSLDWLVAARFASGATIGAFIPLALAWIGDTVAYEKRQPLLARFLVGQMAGVAFGTAVAGWLGEHFGWRPIFWALGALLLVIAVLLFIELQNPLVRGGGGGSIRDMLLGHYPLGWVQHPEYLLYTIGAAIAAALTARLVHRLKSAFLILDAMGLVAFSIIGCDIAASAGVHVAIVVLMGMITGIAGGLLRDILCNEVPLVLRRDLYATVSLLTGALYMGLLHFNVPHDIATLVALGVGFCCRLAAIYFVLALPVLESETGA